MDAADADAVTKGDAWSESRGSAPPEGVDDGGF